jgi:cell division protease FtsH
MRPLRTILPLFLAILLAATCTASAWGNATPLASGEGAGELVYAGTLIQRSNDSDLNFISISYYLDSQGHSYPLDFQEKGAVITGPAGKTAPSSKSLEGLNGAEVQITGHLENKVLVAVSTRVISQAPAIEASRGGSSSGGFLLWLEVHFLTLIVPICFIFIVVLMLYAVRMQSGAMKRKDKMGATKIPSVTWDDVAGVEGAKEELSEIIDFLHDPQHFKGLGAKVPRGVLLHGPPGVGKTMLAKVIATETGSRFYHQSASAFVEVFVGTGAKRIRGLFKAARRNTLRARMVDRIHTLVALVTHKPACGATIIFLDELDAIGKKRGSSFNDEGDRTLNQLLVEMDGFSPRDNIIVIAATNHTEDLDPALLRPGRFDRHIMLDGPDVDGRRDMLVIHTRDKPVGQVDIDKYARQTSGLSGADIANLCNEAAIQAGRRGSPQIANEDFANAFERIIAGVASRKVRTPHELRVTAYHEAGHALVSEMVPDAHKTDKISLIPRGNALGYTLHLPEEDRYIKSREEGLAELACLLGGRVAEEEAIGQIHNGVADDVRRATILSRQMLDHWAMGTTLIAEVSEPGRFGVADSIHSEAFKAARDAEQEALLQEAQEVARAVILKHRPILDAIAERLLEDEVIEREGINAIVTAAIATQEQGRPQAQAGAGAPTA